MALQADANGNQTFVPDNYNGGIDILGLSRPRSTKATTRPPVRPRFSQPRQIGPDLWLGSVTFFHVSGAIRQEDDLVNSLGEVSDSDIICDDWGIARHAFLSSQINTPAPNAPDRVSWADFAAKSQVAIGFYDPGSVGTHDKIYVEDPATGAISASAYAVRANTSGLLCMKPVNINGASYLALGWAGNVSAVDTLELVDKLSAGYASTTYPVSQNATWGITQSPVAGAPVLVYNGTRIAAIRAADVAIGSATVTNMLTGVTEGGYCVGLITLAGTGYAVWAVPTGSSGNAFFNPTSQAAGSARLKLILTDLYGFYVSELKFPLPFIRYANIVNGGIFACDGRSHYYFKSGQYTPAEYTAVDKTTDWPPDSDRDRVCRGHAEQNDRALWVINEIASQHGTGTTKQWFMEFDTDTNITRRISTKKASTFSGEITVGGASQAVSPYTNFLHAYTTAAFSAGGSAGTGTWHAQYQPPASVIGYNQRKTVGAQTGTGQEFEAVCTLRTPAYRGYPGFEGCPVAGVNSKGPPTRHIATGGADAYITVACAGASARFGATEPSARPAARPINRETLSWSYDLQLYVESFCTTTGTDPTRLTLNIFPITVDVLIQAEPPPSIPANVGRMDRSRSRHR